MSQSKRSPFDNARYADYSIFGDCFFERVAVTREHGGRIFWINSDWFESLGIDLRENSTRQRVERRLLASFAIRTKRSMEAGDKTAKADRYGGTGGTAHGGSGRCVYRGRFNVKGVGPTPLVPSGISSHSNGEYLLVEAIRGAVYSELAHYESIAGAIRTLAIIELPPFDLPPEERRCLIVRPNFVRPAHFERSLLFGTAGYVGSDQFKDHIRVQAVRQTLSGWGVGWRDIAFDLARQIGSLDAMRMSQGRFTSSNMSIDGRVADFETFRIFDSWYYTKHVNRDKYIFGKELDLLKKSAARWSQIMGQDRRADLTGFVDGAHRQGFIETMRFLMPSNSINDGVESRDFLSFLYSVFRSHANIQVADPHGWIIDPETTNDDFQNRMRPLARSFGFGEIESIVISARMNAWRMSRSSITLKAINDIAVELISCAATCPDAVTAEIADLVVANRRIFSFSDDALAPILSVRRGDARLLYVLNVEERRAYSVELGLEGLNELSMPPLTACSGNEIMELVHALSSPSSSVAGVVYNEWLLKYVNGY